ncbi:uncharacterized protein LOC105156369 [Sesamum indicum]|uniref:Uncharacterized protein LOC105156369 n=1 Tax=Sesamum indicum TaxID=4182 RepID=A0A6I9SLL8_SESIN|nr:uncharacterized protein LOC105156369 [Sesamum indicum]
MAMGTERSKALHNFTMPCGLRWGNQRFLRCMKVNSNGQISPLQRFTTNNSGSSDHHHQHHHQHPIQQRRTTRDRDRERDKDSSPEFVHGSPKVGPTPPPATDGGRRFSDDDDDGIAAMREKVMFDLQTAADKMKDAIFKDGLEEGKVSVSQQLLPQPPPPPPPPAEGETYRPWNLRTRRAACKTPVSGFVSGKNCGAPAVGGGNDAGGNKILRLDVPRPNSAAVTAHKPPMHRSEGSGMAASGEKRERAKFSVPLAKREIEEDFFAMVGHRPPRRPKKRAKIVQKQLDTLFPGLWLTEVTADMYKVNEAAP